MHKAVIEIGKYTAQEMPTGGWKVFKTSNPDNILETGIRKDAAVDAAKLYDELSFRA